MSKRDELLAKLDLIRAIQIPEIVAGKSTQHIRESLSAFCAAAQAYISPPGLLDPRQCWGKANATKNLRAGPGVHYDLAGTIEFGTVVRIFDIAINDDLTREPSERSPSYDQNQDWYLWYQVLMLGQEEEGLVWVFSGFVDVWEGCELAIHPINFGDQEAIRSGEDVLPQPPEGNIPVCILGNETDQGRAACAAQVYYKFYYEFLARYNRPPTLQELLAVVYEEEFRSFSISPDILRDALIDNLLLMGDEYTGEILIEWLASKQAWFVQGRDELDQVDVSSFFSTLEGEGAAALLENLGRVEPRELGEHVDWGVWPYGTRTYFQILNGTIPTIAYELFQTTKCSVYGRLLWYDYVGAIVDKANPIIDPEQGGLGLDPTDVYDQTRHDRPPWIVPRPDGDDFKVADGFAEQVPVRQCPGPG